MGSPNNAKPFSLSSERSESVRVMHAETDCGRNRDDHALAFTQTCCTDAATRCHDSVTWISNRRTGATYNRSCLHQSAAFFSIVPEQLVPRWLERGFFIGVLPVATVPTPRPSTTLRHGLCNIFRRAIWRVLHVEGRTKTIQLLPVRMGLPPPHCCSALFTVLVSPLRGQLIPLS